MGMQKFRGAGGAGAVGTPRAQPVAAAHSVASDTGDAGAPFGPERLRPASARGWVLALDVERRLKEVRAHVGSSLNPPRSLDEADDVALVRACRGSF